MSALGQDEPDIVKSKYHGHYIARWAVEENCYFCKYPASHKVEEDVSHYDGMGHPLSAYLCCNHFWSTCRNGKDNA